MTLSPELLADLKAKAANQNDLMGLRVEVLEVPFCAGHWLVEGVDEGSEGEVYRATFDGRHAEKRARAYANALPALIAEIERRDQGGVVLTSEDHAVIARCVERMPPLYMRGQHEGYYIHSDVAALIDMIGRAAPPASAPDLGEVVEVLKLAIPSGVCLTNRNVSDDQIVCLDTTMGDLRKIAALLAKIEGSAG